MFKNGFDNFRADEFLARIFAYAIPAITLWLAIPLLSGETPPNGMIGYRTPESLTNPDLWYASNTLLGWSLTGAALLSIMMIERVYKRANRTAVINLLLSLGLSTLMILGAVVIAILIINMKFSG
ncbi:SdpI family protein [Litorimonas sp. WD9-15]|uniref:SdpI family protein n=1 Tax=Litorimonas sp. WD9-15 TaxID=3418716 RepID=UPI003D0726FB